MQTPEQQRRLAEAWEGRIPVNQLSDEERRVLADAWEQQNGRGVQGAEPAQQLQPVQQSDNKAKAEEYRQYVRQNPGYRPLSVDAMDRSNPISAATDGLTTGLLAGYDDELAGAVVGGVTGALSGVYRAGAERDLGAIPREIGAGYERVRDQVRDEKSAQRAMNPVSRMLGEGAGAALGLGKVGQGALAGQSGASLAARSAGLGAVEAGAFASGEADGNLGQRATEAAKAAPVGAALGLVGVVAPGAIASGWSALRNKTAATSTERVGFRVLRNAMMEDHGPNKAHAMLRTWQASGASPEELIKMQGARGQNVIRAAGLLNEGQATDALSALRGKQRGRIIDGIRKTLGGKANTGDVKDLISASMKARANPIYQAAYARGVPEDVYRNELQSFVYNNAPALRGALKIALADGDQQTAQMIRNALANKEQTLNLQALQYFKEGIDDQIQRARRSGSNRLAAALTRRKNEWLSAIDDVNPEYRQARAIWAGEMNTLDAFEQGDAILNGGESVNAFKRRIDGMSESELAAARLAAAERLETKVLGGRDNADDAGRMVNDLLREKLRALFVDDPKQAEGFIRLVTQVDEDFSLFRALDPTTNSRTASNQQAMKELSEAVRNPALRQMDSLEMSPTKTIFNLGKVQADSAFARKQERVAKELADVFFGGKSPSFASFGPGTYLPPSAAGTAAAASTSQSLLEPTRERP